MVTRPMLELSGKRHLVDDRFKGLNDVFLIPLEDSSLLYDPRRSLLLWLTNEELNHIDIGQFLLPDALIPTSEEADRRTVNWAPTSATFSNTQKCTLRCRYCYADGGRLDDAVLPTDVIDATISLILENSMARGVQPNINFLGEGEATADWRSFTYTIDTFRRGCAERGLSGHVALSSNGVFSLSRLDYISKNVDRITFSLDGLREAHDLGRILPNGLGSFDKVVDTMQACDRVGIDYDIRCTATVEATADLPAFVEWVGKNLLTKDIHVEPVFDNSPYAKTAEKTDEPNSRQFVRAFRVARRIGAEYGISLYYSSADLKFKTAFCGVSNAENFVVTSKGIVTSCNEVLREDDARSKTFQYGKWNAEAVRFDIEADKIAQLGRVEVNSLEKCRGCFAKYNCAGDCYAKTEAQYGSFASEEYTPRCEVTRELTRDNLLMEAMASLSARDGDSEGTPTPI